MNNRELLELAAKAAGLSGGYFFKAGGKQGTGLPYNIVGFQIEGGAIWNPITDDGDALRLAVKLHIQVVSNTNGMSQAIWQSNTPSGFSVENIPHEEDPFAATRRAIVRAAAEIGRGMK